MKGRSKEGLVLTLCAGSTPAVCQEVSERPLSLAEKGGCKHQRGRGTGRAQVEVGLMASGEIAFGSGRVSPSPRGDIL